MARPILQIQGLKEFASAMKSKAREVEDRVDIELKDSAEVIRSGAIARTPVADSNLRKGWSKSELRLDYSVYNSQMYAAYKEFGTGQFAANTVAPYDPEWQAHAMEFYVNGKGKIPATPMLYPAVKEEEKVLNKKLEKAIQNELNR